MNKFYNNCVSFIPVENKICRNQHTCVHINKECPKQEFLKACYPGDERLKTINLIREYSIKKEYVEEKIKQIKEMDLHIYDADTLSDIREKDMNFGKLIAYGDILEHLE